MNAKACLYIMISIINENQENANVLTKPCSWVCALLQSQLNECAGPWRRRGREVGECGNLGIRLISNGDLGWDLG
jgi:hypothetical protein